MHTWNLFWHDFPIIYFINKKNNFTIAWCWRNWAFLFIITHPLSLGFLTSRVLWIIWVIKERKKPLTTHHKLKCFNNLSIPLLMGFGQFLKHVALLVPSPFKLNKHERSCDLCPLEKIDYLIYFLNTSKSIPQKIYAKKKINKFSSFFIFSLAGFPKVVSWKK